MAELQAFVKKHQLHCFADQQADAWKELEGVRDLAGCDGTGTTRARIQKLDEAERAHIDRLLGG